MLVLDVSLWGRTKGGTGAKLVDRAVGRSFQDMDISRSFEGTSKL